MRNSQCAIRNYYRDISPTAKNYFTYYLLPITYYLPLSRLRQEECAKYLNLMYARNEVVENWRGI